MHEAILTGLLPMVEHSGNIMVDIDQDHRSTSVVLVDLDGWQILSCEHEVALTKTTDEFPVIFVNYYRHPDHATFFHDARGVTKLRCQHFGDLLKICTAKRRLKHYAELKRPADNRTASFLVYDSDDERAVVQNARAVNENSALDLWLKESPRLRAGGASVRRVAAIHVSSRSRGHRTSRSQGNPSKELLLQSPGQLRLRQRSPNFPTSGRRPRLARWASLGRNHP